MKSPIHSTAQLARQLGLSRWTVSRALNGHLGVDPRTSARIKEAARHAAFAPSLLGSGLRKGRTDLVGICLPDLVDYFLTEKITRLQDALQQRLRHPLIQITGTSALENDAIARFAAMRCAGVVLIASRLSDSDPGMKTLATRGIPYVRIDPMIPGARHSISTDRRKAIADAATLLHELGHRSLVAAGFSAETSYGRQRLAGLEEACTRLGWDFAKDIRVIDAPGVADDFAAGDAMGHTFLSLPKRATAILAINDRVAMGLMQTLARKGVSVPRDVSVIGYDNADFSAHTSPALSTIDPQVGHLISRAVEHLESFSSHSAARFVPPTLVLRSSHGTA